VIFHSYIILPEGRYKKKNIKQSHDTYSNTKIETSRETFSSDLSATGGQMIPHDPVAPLMQPVLDWNRLNGKPRMP